MPSAPARDFPHLRILASAGSGKTYSLTTRYMSLFAQNRPARTILASTFTRAAAGHISDDVLRTLALAALDPKKRKEFNERLQCKELSEQEVIKLLRKLTQSLHSLQIRTLDSFFGSVVRSFSLELGVPLASDIVDEHRIAKLRAEAIRLMLDERKPQDLVDLLRAITQGNSDRSVMNAINTIVKHLYDTYCQADTKAWECVPILKGELSQDQLMEAIDELASCDVPAIPKSIFNTWVKDILKARKQDWNSFFKTGLASKIVCGSSKYGRVVIEPELIDAYQPIIAHAKAILINRLRRYTIATRDLLSLFDGYFTTLKEQQRAMTYSDVTTAMLNAEKLGTMQDICFRLDANLHNLLLDEFQDTSIEQWCALKPIVLEIVSHTTDEKTFFCVGDIKQSIYGWRNAAPEVLENLPDILKSWDNRSAIVDESLEKSYRSSQIVIDVVNKVFESLTENQAMVDDLDAAEKWADGFKKHDTDKKDLKGYAELCFAPRADKSLGEDQNTVRLQHAADIISEIHKKHPHLSIGVLTRSNKSIGRLRFELGPGNHDLPTGGRGHGTLTDSPAINAVLDIIRLADHPDDTIAAFNIANSPLKKIINLHDYKAPKLRQTIAATLRKRLLKDGYAPTIGKWMSQIASACDARELERMEQLIDLAQQFDERSSLRPIDFVDLVETLDVKEVRPAPIEVMTVHQSKGLEFDVVVLADLESALAGSNTGQIVMQRDGATGPITHICRYVNKDILALVPELNPLFLRERFRTVCESLSLLYVAITRARNAIHIIVDPPKKSEKAKPKTPAGILRFALAELETEPGKIIYSHGDKDWGASNEPVAKEDELVTKEYITIKLADATDAPWRSTIASPSALAKSDITSALSLPNEEALARGNVIHALFEQVAWMEDWQETDETLLAIATKAAPRRNKLWQEQQLALFKEMLTKPEVRQALSRNNRDPKTLGLFCEQSFVRLVDGAVQRGFIDRLESERDGSKVISATVIDFKTDDVSAEQTTKAAEDYRLQLEAYRDAAAEILKIDAKNVRMILLYVMPGVAVKL
ncbi:MAG: UvrD-helicase domain-containing protein [Planctomycetes bacterium]|nr:UvrD-helicase domain-containing protein [Planctomycetota bacterium]